MGSQSNRIPGIEVVNPVRRYAPILLIALVGCKPNPGSYLTKTRPAPAAIGWRTHIKPAGGFTIAFPESFEVIDMEVLSKKSGGSSSGLSLLGTSSEPKPGTETLVLGSMGGSQFSFAVIIREDHKHNVSRGGQAQELENRLSRGGLKVIDRSELDLPVGKASRIVTEVKRGDALMRWTGYALVDGHYSYQMIFMGFSTDGSKMPTKQIMRTFRVTKLSPRT